MKNATSGLGRVVALSSDSSGNINRPTLSEPSPRPQAFHDLTTDPVVVAKFWRNRSGEAVIVSLRKYEGRPLIDLRVHFTNKEGKLQPTTKGLALVVARLPDLARAVNKALAKAKEIGLLPDEVP
jgi:hypothetical protein